MIDITGIPGGSLLSIDMGTNPLTDHIEDVQLEGNSLFDRDYLNHVIECVNSHESLVLKLAQTQRKLDTAKAVIRKLLENEDLLAEIHNKYAELNLSFADNWFANVEDNFMHEMPKVRAALKAIEE